MGWVRATDEERWANVHRRISVLFLYICTRLSYSRQCCNCLLQIETRREREERISFFIDMLKTRKQAEEDASNKSVSENIEKNKVEWKTIYVENKEIS